MNQPSLPWALLVVANTSRPTDTRIQSKADPPATVLGRTLALTSIAKTACLLEDRLRPQWSGVVQQLWPANLSTLSTGQRVVEGVAAKLEVIAQQEWAATVILVPFNHCAVEELSWRDSAQGALRLSAANRDTVYLLHDNPDNDPRTALTRPEVCSSSVMIGSAVALLALCRGIRETVMVDLVVGTPDADELASHRSADELKEAPLSVVHIRLAEEYASLQRQDVWHRRSHRIDLHA